MESMSPLPLVYELFINGAKGPYQINGVLLRRVNQAYVIGTSTKVDKSGLNLEKFDDKYFFKEKKEGGSEFFEAEKEEKNALLDEKKDDQKDVDAPLFKAVEAVPDLKAYFGCKVVTHGWDKSS